MNEQVVEIDNLSVRYGRTVAVDSVTLNIDRGVVYALLGRNGAGKSLFEEVIGELADRGITVFITTHDLAGVETFADRIGILKRGRLVLDEEAEALKSRFRRIRFTAQQVALEAGGLAAASVRTWGSGAEAIVSNYDDIAFERFRATSGMSAAEIAPMSLEEIFVAVSGENEAGGR